MSEQVVNERVAARCRQLTQYTAVESVRQHVSLTFYYRMAHQLFQQSQSYISLQQWDHAFVFIGRFINMYSKVIKAHREYNSSRFQPQRRWLEIKGEEGIALWDIIERAMVEEEREIWKHENDQVHSNPHQKHSQPLPKTPGTRSNEKKPPAHPVFRKPSPTKDSSASTSSSSSTKSNAYPSVGKASWMSEPNCGKTASRRRHVSFHRQRSQEAIEMISSGRHRVMEIPSTLVGKFTEIAARNTNKPPNGIETCGILAGQLEGTRLRITTLVIPKQEGSSDMCTMTNEEELFEYCFTHDLLNLGWIHTHPKQTCFLSSVDIHTQCGFQSLLPEAIAIVVAPNDRRQNVGVFRLTEPDGLQLIQNCTAQGFHQHPTNIQIYSSAMECHWERAQAVDVVDMRN